MIAPDTADLIERLEVGESTNALDVLIECTIFQPDATAFDAVPNSAGTKVIYANRDGSFTVARARDWSSSLLSEALRRLRAKESQA